METDKMYRVIRFCGIGMIFLSLSWAVFKSSTPSQQRPSFTKAIGLYTDGKFEEALKFYNTAVLENPNFIHAKRGRARTLMQLGKDQQALDAFNEVLSLDPNSAVSFANRGILEDRMGLYDLAIGRLYQSHKNGSATGKGVGLVHSLFTKQKRRGANFV